MPPKDHLFRNRTYTERESSSPMSQYHHLFLFVALENIKYFYFSLSRTGITIVPIVLFDSYARVWCVCVQCKWKERYREKEPPVELMPLYIPPLVLCFVEI